MRSVPSRRRLASIDARMYAGDAPAGAPSIGIPNFVARMIWSRRAPSALPRNTSLCVPP